MDYYKVSFILNSEILKMLLDVVNDKIIINNIFLVAMISYKKLFSLEKLFL